MKNSKVYDVYIKNKLLRTYQSRGKAMAALYRNNNRPDAVRGDFAMQRVVVWGEQAPRSLRLKHS